MKPWPGNNKGCIRKGHLKNMRVVCRTGRSGWKQLINMLLRWRLGHNQALLSTLYVQVMIPSCHNRYGLAPNFVCCTANFNQGWPKFTQHLVMETADGRGLVIAMYAPVYIKHKLSNGNNVVMNIKTDYPFDDTVKIDVDCGEDLLLLLRIPSWSDNATVVINGKMSSIALPGGSKFTPWSSPLLFLFFFLVAQRDYVEHNVS